MAGALSYLKTVNFRRNLCLKKASAHMTKYWKYLEINEFMVEVLISAHVCDGHVCDPSGKDN